MTLSFSTKWPERMGELEGQPNYFIDKIWHGLLALRGDISSLCADRYYENHIQKLGFGWDLHEEDPLPKLHTIRHDPHNRWKPGMKIHPVINNRTKNRFQFAPVMECKSVQAIEIKYLSITKDPLNLKPMVWIDTIPFYDPAMGIDSGMEQLALNDGFPSVEAFFQYFNADFKGNLIHWTNLKY